ncbi:MAG: tRNA (adenosine(37)-N6)-threonylcarbamoyltransferase complex dimerization subunit type 1 TsaB [Gammaproteobacteria bacterium]|nr:tRNA (adenosine(37)-N6)-threonylcarbamoyltransferase complex dimerization subunit type 1 TsaB [Gammaproteobacteria bacterium]
MRLLALDTTSNACSVALQVGDQIAERHEVEARAHSRVLLPMIRDLLAQFDCTLSQLDAVVLGNGPGSFIGLRIGASVAQGLTFGAGVPLVAISSLAAVAQQCFVEDAAKRVLVAQDARMHEVYLAGFEKTPDGLPKPAFDVQLQSIGGMADTGGAAGRWVAAGDGWHRHAALLQSNANLIESVSELRYPRARALLPSGAAAFAAGETVDPVSLVPTYVRETVARVPSDATRG